MARRRSRGFSYSFLTFACVTSLLLALFDIVSFLMNVIGGVQYDTYNMISLGISVIFYCFIGFQFYKARGGNYGFALYGMLALVISDFLVPALMIVLQAVLSLNFMMIVSLVSMGFGIAYGIILILESRNHKKGFIIALEVLGIILVILSWMTYGTIVFSSISLAIDGFLVLNFYNVFDLAVGIISAVISLMFSLIYALFPFYLSKERR